MCITEESILWGLTSGRSRDAHENEICSYLGIISHWWLTETFCHQEIKVLLIWLWSVYLLQLYSESSFPMFISFVRKEFLSFIWECSTFLTHHTSTKHHILPYTASIKQQLSRKEREEGKKKKPPTKLAVCLDKAHATLDSCIRSYYYKHRQEQ